MPDESRPFLPLMLCIEQMLAAIDAEPLKPSLSQTLQTAADQLRGMHDDFDGCCCRKAHVIKDPPEARVQGPTVKKAVKGKKAKAGKKAGKKVKTASARSKRR